MRLAILAQKLSENSIRALLKMKRRAQKVQGLKTQYQRLRRKLTSLDRKIQKMSTGATTLDRGTPKHRRLSPAGRRRIVLAQKRRWAKKRPSRS